ncbi:MAG TPA: hypothetical protein VHA80_04115 [Solirubrobacterales bacterium]|nr:hypothetical protein [Solirubrobacterales bacterium]
MTEPRPSGPRPGRRPGGAVVFWASATLFAVLFAHLTFQLSRGTSGATTAAASPVQVRKVIKRRIVTTVVPSPGVDRVVSGPATSSAAAVEVPVEPVTTSAS